MALESRSFAGADEIELSPGCKYFNTFGEAGVTVQADVNNPGQYIVTMESSKWPAQSSNYVASNGYPAVV